MKFENFETLKKNSDFRKVYGRKKSYANKLLVMYIFENGTDINRIGISVSKKVGNSIVRHRLTRLIRESIRLNAHKLKKGYDIVIVARVDLKDKNYFETISISEEDRIRAESYIKEAKREEHKQNFKTEEEFLESLEMEIEWGVADRFTEPRIIQLIQRSNQFNLRGVKYSEAELKKIKDNKSNHILYFKLRDKFGEYGLISAIILKEVDENEIFIDTLVMSCRVLKRGVENFIFNKIVEFGFENRKQRVIGEYLKTDKNSMVEGLYEKYGFNTDDRKIWSVDINSYKMQKIFIKKEEFINNG